MKVIVPTYKLYAESTILRQMSGSSTTGLVEGRRFDDFRAVSGESFEFQKSIAKRASILIAR